MENETLSYEVNITSITYVCINLPTDFPISATIIVQYVIMYVIVYQKSSMIFLEAIFFLNFYLIVSYD